MESEKNGVTWGAWLAAVGLAIIVFFAWSALRTTPHSPRPLRSARATSIDISRGAGSSAFTDASPISTRATVRYAASAQNVAKGKDAYCAANHCAFVLSEVLLADVQDRTVKVLGDYPGSTSELTYTCYDCSAGLSLDTFGIPRFTRARGFSGPGVILTLNADGTALSIECRAQTCTTRQQNVVSREFRKGAMVTLPVNPNVQFSFSRL